MSQRTAPGLVATYRIQLRAGVDLDAVRARIPYLRDLGISHLYLSPLFTAASGSTHGYDLIDPNAVDPELGGEEAFQDLSAAARDAGMGIILDIVPNHMALTPENPFIADIMRHGRTSRFAALFDIDWDEGPLHFPVLDGEPQALLESGQIALAGDMLRIYDQGYPLRDAPPHMLTADTLPALLADQHWSVGHWRAGDETIVHRRFFNISGLIGVRQEDAEVFDFTHRWILAQVRAGRVQGLRVDHIDGLARPAAYLQRLREAVGVVPVWVEKIVKQGETLPAIWPVEGMSGYEVMAPVSQLLTQAEGLARLRAAAAGAVPGDTQAEIRAVRRALLGGSFAPELDRVARAAQAALGTGPARQDGLRAAIVQLAMDWPVYRSYAADGLPLTADQIGVLDRVRAGRMPSDLLGQVFTLLSAPDDPLARAFAARFEQLTGALTAKSEEDTVFFRSVSYLPFCEVGGEPDLDPIDAAAFTGLMAMRASETPVALTALSTHDTKRSADARAAIIALSWRPDLGERLYARGRTLARERGVAERWGVYAAQVALILRAQEEREARAADHVAKAMREAKDASSHEDPARDAEAAVAAIVQDLFAEFEGDTLWSDAERQAYDAAHEALILAQVAIQLTAPGVPDLYQGSEMVDLSLTDPDNRRAVTWDRLAGEGQASTVDARKQVLTRELLLLRRAQPELFTMGRYEVAAVEGGYVVRRHWQDRSISLDIALPRTAITRTIEDATA